MLVERLSLLMGVGWGGRFGLRLHCLGMVWESLTSGFLTFTFTFTIIITMATTSRSLFSFRISWLA